MILRFGIKRGCFLVEDLWDLPLLTVAAHDLCLDNMAMDLNRDLKESAEESFVIKANKANAILELKFSIVKHIIDAKLIEVERKENEAAIKAKKAMILEIIGDKEIDTLKGKSKAALKRLYDEL